MYTSIPIPTAPSPPYEQATPQITPFNNDQFSVGPSYSQDQVPEHRSSAHIQIQDNAPPLPSAIFRSSGSGVHMSNSVLTMPIPGTKLAPEKFRGDFHKVKEFVQHYERLCIQTMSHLTRRSVRHYSDTVQKRETDYQEYPKL